MVYLKYVSLKRCAILVRNPDMENEVSEKIPILRGVRQGDPISPKLLTTTIQVFESAQLEETGLNVDGEKMVGVRLADDVTLATEGVKDMEHELNTVNEESVEIGLKICKGKPNFWQILTQQTTYK